MSGPIGQIFFFPRGGTFVEIVDVEEKPSWPFTTRILSHVTQMLFQKNLLQSVSLLIEEVTPPSLFHFLCLVAHPLIDIPLIYTAHS